MNPNDRKTLPDNLRPESLSHGTTDDRLRF